MNIFECKIKYKCNGHNKRKVVNNHRVWHIKAIYNAFFSHSFFFSLAQSQFNHTQHESQVVTLNNENECNGHYCLRSTNQNLFCFRIESRVCVSKCKSEIRKSIFSKHKVVCDTYACGEPRSILWCARSMLLDTLSCDLLYRQISHIWWTVQRAKTHTLGMRCTYPWKWKESRSSHIDENEMREAENNNKHTNNLTTLKTILWSNKYAHLTFNIGLVYSKNC